LVPFDGTFTMDAVLDSRNGWDIRTSDD